MALLFNTMSNTDPTGTVIKKEIETRLNEAGIYDQVISLNGTVLIHFFNNKIRVDIPTDCPKSLEQQIKYLVSVT